jgi:23S rRNA (adenine2503-C2)-methyltransferase
MGCDFCATGRLNFVRNLTAGEIADQLNSIAKDSGKINNVVYMGMGEPLDNYRNVIRSLEIINHHAGKFIGQRHITVSTCGMIDGIEALADEPIKPRLAVSLNAPTDQLREKIMPTANKYPLDRLIASLKIYRKKTKKRITFEYCLIKNLNDSAIHAQKLIELVVGLNPAVNLIEYNPHPGCTFEPSPKKHILRFRDILMNAKIETVIRYKRGQKINAACGQLGAYILKKQRLS